MTPQRPIKIKALSKVWDNYVEEKMAYLKQINFLYVTRNWSCILMVLILVLLSIRLYLWKAFAICATLTLIEFICIGIYIVACYKIHIIRKKNIKTTIEEKFRKKYSCPNCHYFLGYIPYKRLISIGSCQYCKLKLIN